MSYRSYDGTYVDYDDGDCISEEEYEAWLEEMKAQYKPCTHCGRIGEYEWDHAEACPFYREPPLPF